MLNQHYKVLIADDHTILRQGLRALLEASPEIEVIGEASDGHEAVQMTNQLYPDVILIDLSMPKINGTEAIELMRKRNADLRIIALTVHRTEEYVRATLDAGANGYVLKDDTRNELISAIHAVAQGKTYLSPSICGQLVNGYLEPHSISSNVSWDNLTLREREVIKLIAEGNTNKMIARLLSISVKTVEKHRGNLMKKLNLHSASKITAYAIEHRLVEL
jgi:two-component system response regulator NreC